MAPSLPSSSSSSPPPPTSSLSSPSPSPSPSSPFSHSSFPSPPSSPSVPRSLPLSSNPNLSASSTSSTSQTPITRLAKTIPLSPAQLRFKIAKEILSTEVTYVEGLEILIKLYLEPITASLKTAYPLVQSKSQVTAIFANVSEILPLNRELLRRLSERIEPTRPTDDEETDHDAQPAREVRLGDVFRIMMPFMKVYSLYITNFNSAISLVSTLMARSALFATFLRTQAELPESRGLGFQSYLILPVQRIPRYKLLLEEMLRKTSTDDEGWGELNEAYVVVEEVAKFVNETIRQHEMFMTMLDIQRSLTGLDQSLLVPGRTFVRRGTIQKISRKSHQQRELFLFSDCLVYAAPSILESDTYVFHRRLRLEDCRIVDVSDTEAVQNSFQILSPDKSFAVYVASPEEKEAWMRDIRQSTEELLNAKSTLRVDPFLAETSTLRRRTTITHSNWNGGSGTVIGNLEVLPQSSRLPPSASGSVVASSNAPWFPLCPASSSVTSTVHPFRASSILYPTRTPSSKYRNSAFTQSPRAENRRPVVSDYQAPVWVPDDAADRCMRCGEDFGVIIRRKHHCRSCGEVVCGSCSSREFVIHSSTPFDPSVSNITFFPSPSIAARNRDSFSFPYPYNYQTNPAERERVARCCERCWERLCTIYPEEESEFFIGEEPAESAPHSLGRTIPTGKRKSVDAVGDRNDALRILSTSVPATLLDRCGTEALSKSIPPSLLHVRPPSSSSSHTHVNARATPPISERTGMSEALKKRLDGAPPLRRDKDGAPHLRPAEQTKVEEGDAHLRKGGDIDEGPQREEPENESENGTLEDECQDETDPSDPPTLPPWSFTPTYVKRGSLPLRRAVVGCSTLPISRSVRVPVTWPNRSSRRAPNRLVVSPDRESNTGMESLFETRTLIRDDALKRCELCKAEFGLFLWRITCHNCHRIVCGDCVTRRRPSLVGLNTNHLGFKVVTLPMCDPCGIGADPDSVMVNEGGGGWYVKEPEDEGSGFG